MGILFDFYRSLRRWLKWGRLATGAGDLLFSLLALFILFRFFQRANALDFRIYILWGSVLGLFIYLRVFSRVVVQMYFRLFRLIAYFLWLLAEGFKIPVRGIFILMRPPYALLRWFALLMYRILESLLGHRLKILRTKGIEFWNRLFPPRTNG